jgi:hypothetical protein
MRHICSMRRIFVFVIPVLRRLLMHKLTPGDGLARVEEEQGRGAAGDTFGVHHTPDHLGA